MTHTKKFLAEIIKITESELQLLGFRKTNAVYGCQLAEDALGWLGLNVATHRSDGRVGINPVVGVRHERIEKTLAKLLGEKGVRLLPTISTALGYLMPEGRYLEWLFEPEPFDYESECKRMAKAVEVYGVAFMKPNSALDDILRDLEGLRFATKDSAIYRIPVAYLIAGETERALAYVSQQLEEIGTKNDLAAQQYKTFASNLLQEASLGHRTPVG